MKKRNLFNENYDPRDEDYVPEFVESTEDELDIEADEEKFVILGTSEWGTEVLDYADSEEEAIKVTEKYQNSFGEQWDVHYMPSSEFEFDETQMLEDDDVESFDKFDNIDDYDDEDGYLMDITKESEVYNQDQNKIYESIIMKPLR